jgi:molybdopterin/thiamine biosynthesis adenylyltransferase
MLSGAEASLVQNPALGPEALERLRTSRVAVIGAGALGGPLIAHLALLEIGLTIVDSDRVEPANLGNQGFPAGDSLGRWKSNVRARQVAALNPDCSVRAITARVEDLGLAALVDCDAFVTGLDSRISRMHVNALSRQLGKVWIDAALDGTGERLLGTVAVYDARRSDSACFGCRFDRGSLAAIASEGRGPGCPSWRRADVPVTAPTLQTSAFAGVVAGYQALWILRLLLGRGDDLANQQLLIDCDRSPQVRCLRMQRSPQCLFHHAPLAPLRPAPGDTLGALLGATGADLGTEADQLIFQNRAVVMGLRCPDCGVAREHVRMSDAYSDNELRCSWCACEPSPVMEPIEIKDRLLREEVRRLADLNWNDLGLPAADVVTASSGDRVAHYIVNTSDVPGARHYEGESAHA